MLFMILDSFIPMTNFKQSWLLTARRARTLLCRMPLSATSESCLFHLGNWTTLRVFFHWSLRRFCDAICVACDAIRLSLPLSLLRLSLWQGRCIFFFCLRVESSRRNSASRCSAIATVRRSKNADRGAVFWRLTVGFSAAGKSEYIFKTPIKWALIRFSCSVRLRPRFR